MNLKLSYLAIVICSAHRDLESTSLGRTYHTAATAQGVEVSDLFRALLPGLLAAQAAVILVAAYLGKKERRRLGYQPGLRSGISRENIEEMLKAVRDRTRNLSVPNVSFLT